MENFNTYFKQFKIAIIVAILAIAGFIYVLVTIIPQIQNINNIQNEYTTQSSALSDAERKLEDLRQAANKQKEEDSNLAKGFFRSIEQGLDTEAVISDEFGEILQLMRENKIKTRSIKYDYDPQDDNFVKNVSEKYHVCKVTAEMIASYTDFENFLRNLYKHEHFLDIMEIEILPYEKNKRILLINIKFKLYAQKFGTFEASES